MGHICFRPENWGPDAEEYNRMPEKNTHSPGNAPPATAGGEHHDAAAGAHGRGVSPLTLDERVARLETDMLERLRKYEEQKRIDDESLDEIDEAVTRTMEILGAREGESLVAAAERTIETHVTFVRMLHAALGTREGDDVLARIEALRASEPKP